MPFEIRSRWHIDEDILSCFSKEPFPSHLDLDGLGWVLNHFDDHHSTETAQEPHNALNRVDDETPQDEGPGLKEEGEEAVKGARERQMRGEGGGGEEAVKGARERQMRGEGGGGEEAVKGARERQMRGEGGGGEEAVKGARERQMRGEGGGGEEAVKGARERQMRGEGGEGRKQ